MTAVLVTAAVIAAVLVVIAIAAAGIITDLATRRRDRTRRPGQCLWCSRDTEPGHVACEHCKHTRNTLGRGWL